MSIRFEKGRYIVDYYPQGRSGRRIRMTLPEAITDEAQARAIEQQLRRSKNNPVFNVSPNSQVKELFANYLDYYELHRSPQTYRDIKSVFNNHISRLLGLYPAETISENHINIYKRIRIKEKVSNRTITKELHYFSGFLRWCEKRGYITRRDFKIERLPYSRPIPIVLTFAEAIKLIDNAEGIYKAFLLLLFNLGLRFSEARMLKWQDVDFKTGTIKIIRKGGKYNILPITDTCRKELLKLKKTAASVWVFPSPVAKGQPITDIRKAIARAKKKAGITKHIHPHLLRHSMATHMLGKDINLRNIQEILGHSNISTTEFYTQVSVDNKRKALIDAGLGFKEKPAAHAKNKANIKKLRKECSQ